MAPSRSTAGTDSRAAEGLPGTAVQREVLPRGCDAGRQHADPAQRHTGHPGSAHRGGQAGDWTVWRCYTEVRTLTDVYGLFRL